MSGTELDPDGTNSYHPDHPWEQSGHPLYIAPGYRSKGNWPPEAAFPAGTHEESIWRALPETSGALPVRRQYKGRLR